MKSNLESEQPGCIEISHKKVDIDAICCDAPNPGCLLTTRQPTEILYVSCRETHT